MAGGVGGPPVRAEDSEVGVLTEEQIETEIRILIAVLDGVELQWLLGADINLPGLVATHIDHAITRWTTTAT